LCCLFVINGLTAIIRTSVRFFHSNNQLFLNKINLLGFWMRTSSLAKAVSYRADIDGLRAIAVAAVVLFHAFPKKLPGGFAGVDVFFVISGYLITSIIVSDCLTNSFSIAEFYSRRVRRIFPALALVLATTLALGYAILSNLEYKQLAAEATAGAGFVANLLFWSNSGYFDQSASEKPLLHLWSLGVEEQFYIFWPLLVAAMWHSRRYFTTALVTILALSFALSLYETYSSPSAAFYSPLTRFWELLSGGFLACNEKGLVGWWQTEDNAVAIRKKVDIWAEYPNIQSLVGLTLVFLPMIFMDGQSKFPGWWAISPIMGTYLLLKTGSKAWLGNRLFSHPAVVWIGLISYPLYLWHWPLLSFAHMLYPTQPSKWVMLAVIGISVFLASATYVFVERPLRRWSTARIRVVVLSLSMILVTVVSLAILSSGGLPNRFKGVINKIASYTYDYRVDYREGKCFLRADQPVSAYVQCVETPTAETKHLILLWGDSHAAHLYPGLRSTLGPQYRIAEFTSHACAPFLHYDLENHKNCRPANDYILEWALHNRPDVILLAASWVAWMGGDLNKELSSTVEALKRLPNSPRIVVVGPVPVWSAPLPRILLTNARLNPSQTEIPERLSLGYDPDSYKAEKIVLEESKLLQVEYVSILDILCNEEKKCLTHTGPDIASLTAFDEAHLTRAGSAYVAARVLEYLHLKQ
jgi:peptidoglycan/LPS O-acetylase OafA/YrhL